MGFRCCSYEPKLSEFSNFTAIRVFIVSVMAAFYEINKLSYIEFVYRFHPLCIIFNQRLVADCFLPSAIINA